ncbi:hypothetical protein HK101_009458 [Irineochytrium annulatum]|nr:hypothetical protein HK101_009458 [Irineochytrium annulatum]
MTASKAPAARAAERPPPFYLHAQLVDPATFDRIFIDPPPPIGASSSKDFPHHGLKNYKRYFNAILTDADPLADALVAEKGPTYHLKVLPAPGRAADPDAAILETDRVDPAWLAEKLGVQTLPDWVNVDAVRRGQQFHWRNVGAILVVLLHLSLAAGFGVPRVDAVLMSTGYLSNPKKSYRRLVETSFMIVDAMLPDEEGGGLMKVGGKGWLHVIKIRLMHAGVRYRISQAKGVRGGVVVLGGEDGLGPKHVPINQADMIATLLSFSSVVLAGLARLGIPITAQEAYDYSQTWRYIGHLIGVRDDVNPLQWGVDPAFYLTLAYVHSFSVTGSSVGAVLGAKEEPVTYLKAETKRSIRRRSRGSAKRRRISPPAAGNDDAAETQDQQALQVASKLSIGVLTAVSECAIDGKSVGTHATMTRLLVGDGVADALNLPTGTDGEKRHIGWFVFWLGVLAWLMSLPILGEWLIGRTRGRLLRRLEKEIEGVERRMEMREKKRLEMEEKKKKEAKVKAPALCAIAA